MMSALPLRSMTNTQMALHDCGAIRQAGWPSETDLSLQKYTN